MPTSIQRIPLTRTSTRTTVAAGWFSVFDVAGNPGAGTLAGSNTANGVVPVAGGAGYASLMSFGGGTGFISRAVFGNTVTSRIRLFDRLFVCGAYAFNANTALTGQPSYAGRVPGFYYGTQIWVEQVTAATGNQAVNVSYLDQDGNAGSTGAVGIGAAPTVGRCWQLPLASGDTGVQRITNVTGSVASAGTFNVMVLRPIFGGRINLANVEQPSNGTKVPIYQTSALYVLLAADSTSSGLPDLDVELMVVT